MEKIEDEILYELIKIQKEEGVVEKSYVDHTENEERKDRILNTDRNTVYKQKKTNYSIGIIPTLSYGIDFRLPWHECLMPLNKNLLAVERSVYECVVVGCRSIWIVGNQEITPLIRHRLGDIIPGSIYTSLIRKNLIGVDPETHFKDVPIYYVPLHPRDEAKKRISLSWAILYGARRALNIAKGFSRFSIPNTFWVSFPWGVFYNGVLNYYRTDIRNPLTTFLRAPNGKTVKDNELLSFSFDPKYWRFMMRRYIQTERLLGIISKKKEYQIPMERRFSGRFIQLSQILLDVPIQQYIGLEWFYDISSWEGYKKFLGSEHSNIMIPPLEFADRMVGYDKSKDVLTKAETLTPLSPDVKVNVYIDD